MKPLEEQLNGKADAELNRLIDNALEGLSNFPASLGGVETSDEFTIYTKLKNTEGAEQPSLCDYKVTLRNHLFHGYRDAYREAFRAKFIQSVVDLENKTVVRASSSTVREIYLCAERFHGVKVATEIFEKFKHSTGKNHVSKFTAEERGALVVEYFKLLGRGKVETIPGIDGDPSED